MDPNTSKSRAWSSPNISWSMSTPTTRVGFGSWPALIMVDFYRWVFGDEPQPLLEAVKTWPGSCGMSGWSDAVHVADGPRPKPTDAASLDRHRRRYDIVDELAPIPGEGRSLSRPSHFPAI